jgi:hypothetical protein
MIVRHRFIQCGLILSVAAGLVGCEDRGVGTIHADRKIVEQLERANSDRPSPPSQAATKRPDLNDLSPKLRTGGARR